MVKNFFSSCQFDKEIFVGGILDWEVTLQKCLGQKFILLHAIRFGTIHLAIFIRHNLQSNCSTVDWGVLSVRFLSQIKTKGVAACAVQIFGTKFLFMNSHFAVSLFITYILKLLYVLFLLDKKFNLGGRR